VGDQKPIEELLEGYRSAVQAKDVEAFVAIYDQEVRVFDMWGRWVYTGLDEWRQMAAGWFRSLGNERVAVRLEDVQTVITEDLAAAHAFVTFKGLSAQGEELRAMDNRLTWVLHKTGQGGWKVIHEHSSAPVDAETATPILQRRAGPTARPAPAGGLG
jgi:uncharacterized protein (TIGR02246 family)